MIERFQTATHVLCWMDKITGMLRYAQLEDEPYKEHRDLSRTIKFIPPKDCQPVVEEVNS